MRAYRVSVTTEGSEGGDGEEIVRYAGTNADATATRQSFVNDYGVMKKHVTIEEVEIPTAKADLLSFINGLVGS